jgi:hypothetical protein
MTTGGYAEPIYPTIMLEPLVGPLRRAGVAVDPILRAAGLTEQALSNPATLVSIDQTPSAYQAIVDAAPDPILAYRLGLAFHVTTRGMYGFAMLSSATFGQALDIALRYRQLGSPSRILAWSDVSTSLSSGCTSASTRSCSAT